MPFRRLQTWLPTLEDTQRTGKAEQAGKNRGISPYKVPSFSLQDKGGESFGKGATRDIGSALTRMCMRHRSIETKLRHFTNVLMEGLVTPLQDKIEEWKKTANQLDKDHAKEYKRSRQEIKRKSLDTIKLQKKARKGRGNLRPQLDSAMQDVSDMYLLMEETEKQAVRRALLEERGRYCAFINLLQPVVNVEIAMLGEITHLQPIVDDLKVLTEDPHKLPPASEQVIRDLKGSDYSWSYQTPPSSPSSAGSRKSSMCSLLQMPSAGAHRLSSVSSHDSGFVSQDANTHSKPPSPMPSDITSQKSTSSASSEASETCQSVSECNSPTAFGSCSSFGTFRPAFSHTATTRPLSVILPASPTFNHSPGSNTPSPTSKVPSWKDWAKLSSCEPSLAATLQRRRGSVDKMRDLEAPPSPQGYSGMQPDDPHRARIGPGSMAAKHGEPLSPAASTLAMVLTRGLSMEQQKSSRDSLQYSSGYSTQTNTPSCSEDTIPSQGSDYECYSLNGDADSEGQADFDRSSTIPRHSNIAQSYRRMIQTKRPASTAGLPAGKTLQGIPNDVGGNGSRAIASGTATIRRTPSSKTGVRRTPSTSGPIPIRPPIVPVKTPSLPDSPGYASPSPHRGNSEDFLYGSDPSATDYMWASPKRRSLPDTARECGGGEFDRPVYAQHAPGAVAHCAEEDPQLAANRHSLVEKIGELAASAHALGEGHFPFPSSLPEDPAQRAAGELSSATQEDVDMLVSIRRGVKLRKAVTDDRSAPRILR
ncbi:MTSS I-BAR domain containing 2a isoform X4 [Betta splendens]|uniref:MTSS I-BAR domain containing 2a isoform X4 n=1 Tax=Betta splendens TaxID=158456 RepID=A0A9W2XV92_BETSP|nr:MTSS I-BAR domain containing 2a isoform X4 [Betta splendens]XP_055365583.1 MTSS I-BAR domain containing 2a isoform X4 [Betta splendens]